MPGFAVVATENWVAVMIDVTVHTLLYEAGETPEIVILFPTTRLFVEAVVTANAAAVDVIDVVEKEGFELYVMVIVAPVRIAMLVLYVRPKPETLVNRKGFPETSLWGTVRDVSVEYADTVVVARATANPLENRSETEAVDVCT